MKRYILLFCVLLIIESLSYGQYIQCTNNGISPPDELFRKRLKDHEPGFRYGGPYTMFNTTPLGWSLVNTHYLIQNEILRGSPAKKDSLSNFAKLFLGVLDHAKDEEPGICAYDQKDCDHPIWVKNNSIAFFIGLKDSTDPAQRVHLIPMTSAERIYYYNRAQNGLRNINTYVS
jgi:hypothetical protein